MKLVARPSRLRVAAASRRQHEHRAGRPMHSQARTPALHPPGGSWSQCMRKNERGLSMNLKVGQPSRGPAVAPEGRGDACPNFERAKIVSRLIPDSEFCD